MKNINQILSENFTKQEISKIEEEAKQGAKDYMALKEVIANEINDYVATNNMTFKDVKERLDTSTSQAQRIVAGKSNFTLETLIKVGNLIGKKPKIIFE
jgi:predicted XRE-type DNA-binding protein